MGREEHSFALVVTKYKKERERIKKMNDTNGSNQGTLKLLLMEQEKRLESIEDITRVGLNNVATQVHTVCEQTSRVADEIKNLREILVKLVVSERSSNQKMMFRIIVLVCGAMCAIIAWFTGVEPNLPSHSPLIKGYHNEARTSETRANP